MKRRGLPIADHPLQGGGVNPGIQFNPAFGEWEAATAAGLDMYKWETAVYPTWFMARVITWHKYHILVDVHTQDAINRKASRRKR